MSSDDRELKDSLSKIEYCIAPNPAIATAMGVMTSPAFDGANFDGNGGCLRHPDVRLMQKMFTDEGKVVYKELMRRCPKCSIKQQQLLLQQQEKMAVNAASNSRSNNYRRETSMASECASSNDNPLIRSSSRSRSRARSKSRERDTATPKSPPQSRSASKPRQSMWGQVPSQRDNIIIISKKGGEGSITTRDSSSHNNTSTKKVFDSPFDPKGRCHYHPNISLAKKKLTGGWKVGTFMSSLLCRILQHNCCGGIYIYFCAVLS